MDDIKSNEDDPVEDLLSPEQVQFYNNIMDVRQEGNGKYLVQTSNGEQVWVVLRQDHPKIVEYLRKNDDGDVDL